MGSGGSYVPPASVDALLEEKLRFEFNAADKDGNGVLSIHELEPFLREEAPTLLQFSKLIVDLFGNKGKISFEMFITFYNSLSYIGKDETNPNSLPMLIFSKMDKDNSFYISYKEIKYLCCMLNKTNEKVTKAQAKAIIADQHPSRPEWGLSRDEFIKLFDSYIRPSSNPLDAPATSHSVYGAGKNTMKQLGERSRTLNPELIVTPEEELVCVSAGDVHTIFVYKSGKAFALGSDSLFQIGMGEKRQYDTPTEVTSVPDVVWARCGDTFTVYLTRDGRLVYCGPHCNGIGDNKRPFIIENKRPFAFVSGDANRICAIDTKGNVYIFDSDPKRVPRKAKLPLPAYDVAIGKTPGVDHEYALAIAVDGTVYGMGVLNNGYQSFAPLQCMAGKVCRNVFSYKNHAAILTKDGNVFLWGKNEHGQLGSNSMDRSATFKMVANWSSIVSVGVGGDHTVLVTANGDVVACGMNRFGQLMIGGVKNDVHELTKSTMITEKATFVVCGNEHSIVIANGIHLRHPGTKGFGLNC